MALDRVAHQRARPAHGPRGTACPSATRYSARSTAADAGASAASCIRCGVEDRRRQQPAQSARARADLVDGVEERLLVLLEIPVVGEREPLQRREQRRSGGRSGARPCPGRARRRRGSSSAAASTSPSTRRRGAAGTRTPRSTTAPPPRRCGRGARRAGRGRRGARRRSRGRSTASREFSKRSLNPRSAATPSGSSGSDEPARAPGPERRHVEPAGRSRAGGRDRATAPTRGPAGGGPAGPAGPAACGCSRAGRRRPPPRPGRAARPGGRMIAPPDRDDLVLAPQPQVGGDLVVAAPPGVQPGPGRPGDLGDPPLDGGVDVLVAGLEGERRRRSAPPRPGRGRRGSWPRPRR